MKVTAVVYDHARLPIGVAVSEISVSDAFFTTSGFVVVAGYSQAFIGATLTTGSLGRAPAPA